MDRFSFDELEKLMETTEGTHVSIFMPTHVGGGQNPQDLIRYKNLLQNAESQLAAIGTRTPDIRSLLKPAETLQQDNLFWRQQVGSLALFLDANRFFHYRVPLDLVELVITAERFYLKPLIPLLSGAETFYVLALSQNKVRLVECTAYSALEVTPAEVPKNIGEAIQAEAPEKEVVRIGIKSTTGGGDTAIFKGTGISPHAWKREITDFFRKVDAEVSSMLKKESAPMVLAAVDYLQPLYRSVNTYASLLPDGIMGNPDQLNEETLRNQGRAIAESYLRESDREAAAQYHQSEGTGLTSNEITEIVEAAYTGRVKFLFAARGIQEWGHFDADSHRVELHGQAKPGSQDLLDTAVYYTLLNNGENFVKDPAEVPGGRTAAAVYRYWAPARQG